MVKVMHGPDFTNRRGANTNLSRQDFPEQTSRRAKTNEEMSLCRLQISRREIQPKTSFNCPNGKANVISIRGSAWQRATCASIKYTPSCTKPHYEESCAKVPATAICVQ